MKQKYIKESEQLIMKNTALEKVTLSDFFISSKKRVDELGQYVDDINHCRKYNGLTKNETKKLKIYDKDRHLTHYAILAMTIMASDTYHNASSYYDALPSEAKPIMKNYSHYISVDAFDKILFMTVIDTRYGCQLYSPSVQAFNDSKVPLVGKFSYIVLTLSNDSNEKRIVILYDDIIVVMATIDNINAVSDTDELVKVKEQYSSRFFRNHKKLCSDLLKSVAMIYEISR